jgi:hypothetical protein
MPALLLPENERDHAMLAIIPAELTVERSSNELGDAEGQTIDVHARFRPTLLILPGGSSERR